MYGEAVLMLFISGHLGRCTGENAGRFSPFLFWQKGHPGAARVHRQRARLV